MLLDAGVDKEAKDNDGDTALIWAARKGHTACVLLLMYAGVDKQVRNNDGWTALDCALQNYLDDSAKVIASF
jgi:ankyrin repeat protein